jgi:hypothetical protein
LVACIKQIWQPWLIRTAGGQLLMTVPITWLSFMAVQLKVWPGVNVMNFTYESRHIKCVNFDSIYAHMYSNLYTDKNHEETIYNCLVHLQVEQFGRIFSYWVNVLFATLS